LPGLTQLLNSMSPEVRVYLDALLEGDALWVPRSLPQLEAYLSPADILFYGGAAGGGKSDLLLGLSMTAHRKSMIFRREYPQLQDLIDRSHELLATTTARYNAQRARWIGIPGNRILEFGAIQHERFKEKFKGRPHDLKAFDEVCDFTDTQFRFITAWTRTVVPDQRTRIVCAGNPPSQPEGEWVIPYWAPWLDDQHPHPAATGELRWYATLDGEDKEVESGEPFTYKGEKIEPKSRTFIPALLEDNPYLRDTDYRATIQALPEPLRSQLLLGDFKALRDDKPRQVIPSEWVKAAMGRWTRDPPEGVGLSAVGVDAARGGRDKTVIAKWFGTWMGVLEKYAGIETPDGPSAAALVLESLEGFEGADVGVDVIGIGASVYDVLEGHELAVTPVNFSERTLATDRSGLLRFHNVRAEAYWKLREALEPELGDNIALPPDDELRAELVAPTWKLTSRGILMESKADIHKRLRRSPNCADAAVIAYWISSAGAGVYFK